MKTKIKEEERKRSYEDDKKMLDYSARVEREYQDKQAAKREQLKKVQQENLQAALLKQKEKSKRKSGNKESI